ncbi:MAG: cysteine--tRNA ligase, partial [Patescibacteria group bacterium]
KARNFKQDFINAVSDDLQAPKALAVLWDALKSNLETQEKLALILDFDKVLGLNLDKVKALKEIIPNEILKLAQEREEIRKNKNFKKSDELRKAINVKGYDIKDTKKGPKISKKILTK